MFRLAVAGSEEKTLLLSQRSQSATSARIVVVLEEKVLAERALARLDEPDDGLITVVV